MVLDTTLFHAAQKELEAARDELARAQARFAVAEDNYETARRMLQAAMGTISLLLDTPVPEAPAMPASRFSPLEAPTLASRVPTQPVSAPVPAPVPPASGQILQSVWSVLMEFPRDGGEARIDAVRDRLGLSGPACATRFVRAKKDGWIESTTAGVYRLTEKGRQAVENRRPVLQVVPNEGE